MRDIWVISDTHFNHENILDFVDDLGRKIRPFGSVDEMNDRMITRWNETVKPGDIVYHLGDVAFGDKESFKKLWPKLHGAKRLLVGNHDDIKFLSSGGFFKKIGMWRVWPEYDLVMTHVPIDMSQTGNYKSKYHYNVHGHIHHNKSPSDKHFNMSVEAINYTPMNLEDVVMEMKK